MGRRAAGDRPVLTEPLLILAHAASWEQRFQVSSLAASKAAAGARVDITLFFAALQSWVARSWDIIDPGPPLDDAHVASLGLPPLSSMLEPGREQGLIRVYACSASLRLLGLDTREAQQHVDAILGWQSFSRMIDAAPKVVTF